MGETTAIDALLKSLPIVGPILVLLIAAVVWLFRKLGQVQDERVLELKAGAKEMREFAEKMQATTLQSTAASDRMTKAVETLTEVIGDLREKVASIGGGRARSDPRFVAVRDPRDPRRE